MKHATYQPLPYSDTSLAVDAALGRIASDLTLLRQRPMDAEQVAWLGRLIEEAEQDVAARAPRRRGRAA